MRLPLSDRACNEGGFTLLEILVVIAILGLLIGLVAPAALRQLGGARLSVAKQSIERIGAVLDMYKLDVGAYPSTEQGLKALVAAPSGVGSWNGPYLKGDVPIDPWNHPYTVSQSVEPQRPRLRPVLERAGRHTDGERHDLQSLTCRSRCWPAWWPPRRTTTCRRACCRRSSASRAAPSAPSAATPTGRKISA